MRRTTKELAGRIEPTYHRRWHPLRRARTLLSIGFVVVGVGWAFVGGETIHSNGELAASHAFLDQQCDACHTESFHAVSDASCKACHPSVANHQDKHEQARCASCHREHRGRSGLARVADAHCNRCHTDHLHIVDLASHAEFEAKPHDQAMRFNHVVHMEETDCASCHEPEGGGHVAISFDRHCASCHTERLDADIADETVPHGMQPAELRDWVASVYLRRMRADPSLVAGTETEAAPTWSEALATRTDRAVKGLLQPGRETGCLLCHTMKDDAIAVPSIPASWQPAARFDHRPHRNLSCASCHDMRDNRTAAQLSMPGVASCRECHKPDGVADGCDTCHPHHR